MEDERLTRADVLAAIDREQASWDGLIAEIGPERMTDTGITERWSFRDVAVHLSYWRERTLELLEAEARGEPDPLPPWPEEMTEDDEINAWFDDLGRGQDVDTVLAETAAGFDRLRQVVESLSEEELSDPRRFPALEGEALGTALVSGEFFDHFHGEHEPDIRRWLDEQ